MRPIVDQPPPGGPPVAVNVDWRVGLNERGVLVWKPQELSSAATDGLHVFVGSQNGTFQALRARDGAKLWSRTLTGGIDSEPIYDDSAGLVYVGADDGVLSALDATSGSIEWTYRLKGSLRTRPTVAGDFLYVTSSEGRVVCLNARTGKFEWQYEREPPEKFTVDGFAGTTVTRDSIYTGFADGNLVRLRRKNGELVWTRSLGGSSDQFVDVDTTPLVVGNLVVAASYSGGLAAVHPSDGKIEWHADATGLTGLVHAGGYLYGTAAKTGLHVFDLQGHAVWRQALASAGALSLPRVVRDTVLFSGSETGLFVVGTRPAQLLALFSPGPGISAPPTLDGGSIYVLSNGGVLYKLHVDALD